MIQNYFELNWLFKRHNSCSIPKLFFIENYKYSGGYRLPNNKEYIINEKQVYNDTGIIMVNITNVSDNDILGTIAHEWRHHLQYWAGKKRNTKKIFDITQPREQEIIRFFMKYSDEMDALLYCLNRVPNNIHSLKFYELIIKDLEKINNQNIIKQIKENYNA